MSIDEIITKTKSDPELAKLSSAQAVHNRCLKQAESDQQTQRYKSIMDHE